VYSTIIDELIQNSDVDPSVEIFITPWAFEYCELKTLEIIVNHPNVVSNIKIWRHSGQIAENCFSRKDDKDDALDLLIKQPSFNLGEAFKLSTWNDRMDFIKWCVENIDDLSKVETDYIERGLHVVSSSIEDGAEELLKQLFIKSKFPKNFDKNHFAIVAYYGKQKELVEWFKQFPEVQETAAEYSQQELIKQELVDLFIF